MLEPRELTADERAILRLLCDRVSGLEAHHLGAQVDAATVAGGLPSLLDLSVPRTVEPASIQDGLMDVRAFVLGSTDEVEGELLVWVSDGYLSNLELAWYSDNVPLGMPSPERVQIP